MKGSAHQEDIAILNISALNDIALKYIFMGGVVLPPNLYVEVLTPNPPTPWSGTSRLHNYMEVNSCCLSHPGCGSLFWQP